MVLLRDLDGQAVRVVASETAVAALWRLPRPAIYDGQFKHTFLQLSGLKMDLDHEL